MGVMKIYKYVFSLIFFNLPVLILPQKINLTSPKTTIKNPYTVLQIELQQLSNTLSSLNSALTRTIPTQKYTQTQALLSIPSIKNLVYKQYPLLKTERGRKFKKDIIRLEVKHKETHYVFYHALTKAWLVPQDLMLELTRGLRPLTSRLPKFRFLRWQDFEKQTASEFLMKEISAEGLINDNSPEHRASLLSVNLALFGNVGFEGESTFDYFVKPKSHATVNPDIIKSILKIYDAPETYLNDILALDEKYLSPEKARGAKPEPQALLQIFIPKQLVDDIGYVAWVQGIPYERELVALVDNLSRYSLKKPPAFLTGTEPILKKIKNKFKQEKENDPLYAKIVKHIKKGKFRLSTLLEKYTNLPETIPSIQNLQARLLFSNELLLNPSSNILFYTHDMIPQKNKKLYKIELKKISDKTIKEKLMPKSINAPI